MRGRRAAAAVVVGVVAAAVQVTLAQMDSPLKGQGSPDLSTRAVFVSAYLDRLLEVDDSKYRHEVSMYFFVSWIDTTVIATITKSTRRAQKTGTCKLPCSSKANNLLCCDDMYIPSFYFRNAFAFSQDREVGYTLHFPSEAGSVLWEVRVHGSFYQPMSFRNYPFDSFDLLIELEFFDTRNLDTHPGVELATSSSGLQLYSYGKGDDTSQWTTTAISLLLWQIADLGEWFQTFSIAHSNVLDPLPLATNETYNADSVFAGYIEQMLDVVITVERFWRFHLINSVLPVTLVAFLGLMIFALDHRDMGLRLEIIVTLFLALTAVQFVLADRTPTSSYVVPTQQLVLTTYIFLMLISIESIVVFHISHWRERTQLAKRRRTARREHVMERRSVSRSQTAARGAGSRPPPSFRGMQTPKPEQDGKPLDLEIATAASGDAEIAAGGIAYTQSWGSGSGQGPDDGAADGRANQGGSDEPARGGAFLRWFRSCWRRPKPPPPITRLFSSASSGSMSTLQRMETDDYFAQHVAHVIDVTTCTILALGYTLAAILIFTLQHGYINVIS